MRFAGLVAAGLLGCSVVNAPDEPPTEGTAGTGGAGLSGAGGTGTTGGSGGTGGSTPPDCGDGDLDSGEDCDLGSANGAATSCCTLQCGYVTAATVCRPSVLDGCDTEETCSGASGECPADVAAADDTPCTANGVSECSGTDTCQDGACDPGDAASGTPCSDGVDQPICNPDTCDGSGACVDQAPLADGTACTNAGNTCCGGACVQALSAGTCHACALPLPGALSVTITESQTTWGAAQDMDQIWFDEATTMVLSPSIQPLTVLDSIASLSSTDILIVSHYQTPLSATRIATIQSFLTGGGGVYIQSEYMPTYPTNLAFAQLVNDAGASYSWTAEVSGDLVPMAVLGCYASYPEPVSPLTYYWYGHSGTGTGAGFANLLAYNGQPVGFAYCYGGDGGLLLTSTDQDWIRSSNLNANAQTFLRNMLRRLGHASWCG